MAAAINPADKSLILVIELFLSIQQAKIFWPTDFARIARPLCGSATLASPSRLLTKLRLQETEHELKCIPSLGDSFGSLAGVAAVLLPIPEAGNYSAAAAQCFSASPSFAHACIRASARAR
jgi:hypothetical protein